MPRKQSRKKPFSKASLCLFVAFLIGNVSAKYMSSTYTHPNHTTIFNQSWAPHAPRTGRSGQAPAHPQPGTTPLLSPWQAFHMAQHNPRMVGLAVELLLRPGPDAAGGVVKQAPHTNTSRAAAAGQTDDGNEQLLQQHAMFESLFGLKVQFGLDDPAMLLPVSITVMGQVAAAGAPAGGDRHHTQGDPSDPSVTAPAPPQLRTHDSASPQKGPQTTPENETSGNGTQAQEEAQAHGARAPVALQQVQQQQREEHGQQLPSIAAASAAPPPPSQRTNRTHPAPLGSTNALLKASPAARRLRQALRAAKQQQQRQPRAAAAAAVNQPPAVAAGEPAAAAAAVDQPPAVATGTSAAAAAAEQPPAVAASELAAAAVGQPPAVATGERAAGSKRRSLRQRQDGAVQQQRQRRERVPAPARGVVEPPKGYRTAPGRERQPSKLLTQRRRRAARH